MVTKRESGGGPNDCRRMHPRPMKLEECCKVVQILKLPEQEFQDCIKDVSANPAFQKPPPGSSDSDHQGPPDGGRGPKVHMPCVVECVFNKTGSVGSDGKLDKDALEKIMLKLFTDEAESLPVIKSAIDKCVIQGAELDHTNHICKSGAAFYKHCIEREFFLNCPSSKWTESEECGKIKTHFQECSMFDKKLA